MEKAYQYPVKVLRVIDGDTFVGDVDLGIGLVAKEVHFRLRGINTPEKNEEGYYEAKEFLAQCLEDSQEPVWISYYGKDKYGRWLVDVHVKDTTLNEILIKEGLAKVYTV